MFKGFFLFYLLSIITRNPLLALILLVVLYVVADKAYFGFLPDLFAPVKRSQRIRALQDQLALNPADANAAQELGILFFEKKKYSRAVGYLEQANKKVTNSARLYLYMGMAYMEMKETEKGKQELDQAVELDRRVGHGIPYIFLLDYELKKPSDNAEMVKRLEEGLTGFANTENFFRMGMVYKKAGDRQKARDMFEKALSEYSYVPRRMRRIHRKWAVFSRFQLLSS